MTPHTAMRQLLAMHGIHTTDPLLTDALIRLFIGMEGGK